MARRLCSECGGSLPSGSAPTRKTCSDACRGRRSRRLKASRKRAGEAKAMPEHQKELEVRVRDEVNDAIGDAVSEELKPVVREAITEDVLRAVQELVGLTPTVVAAIREDLASDDATIRQRAYSLVAKYTIGHPAIVRPEDDGGGQQLVVNLGLPRPEPEVRTTRIEPEVLDVPEDAAIETKECDKCRADKPVEQFVAGSDRCRECFDQQQAEARKMISGDDS